MLAVASCVGSSDGEWGSVLPAPGAEAVPDCPFLSTLATLSRRNVINCPKGAFTGPKHTDTRSNLLVFISTLFFPFCLGIIGQTDRFIFLNKVDVTITHN